VPTRYAILPVFLDFEASSLRERSYPNEVGWVFEAGKAEAIHHIARERPCEEGGVPRSRRGPHGGGARRA
jgi:hypothetical protein